MWIANGTQTRSWYGLNFPFIQIIPKRHLEGRKRVLSFHQRASSPERPCVYLPKQKVLRAYSGAEDYAPSLTGSRDDDPLIKTSMFLSMLFKLYQCSIFDALTVRTYIERHVKSSGQRVFCVA